MFFSYYFPYNTDHFPGCNNTNYTLTARHLTILVRSYYFYAIRLRNIIRREKT